MASRERLGGDWEVAQALAGQRLLTVGRDDQARAEETAEIAHEALIREWPTLASWVNDDAEFQHWLTSAEERAADGELLPDTRLAEADSWLAERAEDMPHEVTQLIQDSKSEWLRRVTELENAGPRGTGAGAEARRLAAAAELALTSRGTSLQVPIALAIEALRTAPVLEADTAIRHAIRTAARQISRVDHDGPVLAVAFSPDGTRIATGSADRSARVFDAATGAEISRLDHDGPVNAVAFSPDGTRVGHRQAERYDSARVFDAATGAEISRLDHDASVNAVAFSPDGTRVATGSADDGSARVFDAATGDRDLPPGPRRPGERGGVQPGRHPGRHRQQRVDRQRQRAGVRCGDRDRDLAPGPRRPGERGGVQPGRHPDRHRTGSGTARGAVRG